MNTQDILAEGQELLCRLEATESRRRPPIEPKQIEPVRPDFHHIRSGETETLWLDRAGRKIHGTASTSTVNSHNYALLAKGCSILLPVPLLGSHEPGRIGWVVYARKTPTSIYVQATIDDNEIGDLAWSLVMRGELKGFSGAADHSTMRLQGHVNGIKIYDAWRLKEVSLCERGANPDCNDVRVCA